MEIQGLPTTGCNVFNGTYVDNYNGTTRSRYYIYEGQAILNNTATNTSRPTGSVCMSITPEYKPELELYIQGMAMATAILTMGFAIWIILGRLLKR